MPRILFIIAIMLSLSAMAAPAHGQFRVRSHWPGLNAHNIALDARIEVRFNRPVDETTLPPLSMDHVYLFAKSAGVVPGAWTLTHNRTRLIFTPTHPWPAGEVVHVALGHGITASDGDTLRSSGYAFRFRTRTRAATATFTTIDEQSVDFDGGFARIYGASVADLNMDRAPDLAIVCQNSSDIRIMMNEHDCTGRFSAIAQPPSITGSVPSPSETVDVDRDGLIDIITCNTSGNSASVVRGTGSALLSTPEHYPMGTNPRGLAVLDANGDSWPDIVLANTSSNNLMLRLNNGSGLFGEAVTFEGGGSGEYGLTAADMNNDGIDDLIVGARFSQTIIVHTGNGDGTFTAQTPVPAGGGVWMIVAGDINLDGNMDITTANGSSNSGSILYGDGTGMLSAPQVYTMPGFTVATDLGDINGDCYLDLILSSFGGGQWSLFLNNRYGSMTFDQSFPAASNPACCVVVDVDGDRDLDLVLLDEIADLVTTLRNDAAPDLDCPADCSPVRTDGTIGNGVVNIDDLLAVIDAQSTQNLACDISPIGDNFGGCSVGNGIINLDDLLETIVAFGACE